MNKILVIDDDTRLRSLLGKFLEDNNFIVNLAKNALEAKEIINKKDFDILVLDVMMPHLSGIEFAKDLRKNNNKIPILMLTAMAEIEDRIEGLEAGADDYLAKPFEPKELLLRIKNILNRKTSYNLTSANYKFGNFIFNSEDVRLKKNDDYIHITESEANILKILCQNLGKKISRDELSKSCNNVDQRSIDVQITRLRRKIEDNPKQPNFLQTVRGHGYILQK